MLRWPRGGKALSRGEKQRLKETEHPFKLSRGRFDGTFTVLERRGITRGESREERGLCKGWVGEEDEDGEMRKKAAAQLREQEWGNPGTQAVSGGREKPG